MTYLRSKSIFPALAGLVAAATLAGGTAVAAETLTLYPYSLVDRRGESSEQPLEVLALRDQSGEQDDWERYIEFQPSPRGYRGVFKLDVPEGVDVDAFQGLEMILNYRGPTRAEQPWRWQLRDYAAGRWVGLGDNAEAGDWEWSELRFPVPGDPGDYLDSDGRFKLRYLSKRDHDASQMDYLALEMRIDAGPPVEPPPASGWHPAPGTSWQWQLSGPIDTSFAVAMYDIDLFEAPQDTIDQLHAAGRTVICYFSAGSWEEWRPDAGRFPADIIGRSNGWPGERWVDIRRMDVLGPILEQRLDLAVEKRCDGVEPDNVAAYDNRSGFPLSAENQLAFNRWLAEQAHARGLSVGLKNDLGQIEELEPWFDWALNEECFQFRECDLLLPFIRAAKAVFGVEYQGDPSDYCPRANALGYDWLIKDLDLGAARGDCRDYP